MFDADYAVYNENDEKWMLIDAVGSMWDDGYVYYLKHRAPDARAPVPSTRTVTEGSHVSRLSRKAHDRFAQAPRFWR